MSEFNQFQRVKRIMSEPIRPPEPYNDTEIEALMHQPPLSETDFPNDGMQLPAEEQNDPNQLQLI
jgi:hypothetical protein